MGRNTRTLQELTFKDGFLFAATLLDGENCRLVLERILEMPIDHVVVSREKSMVYHPDYKGVRLDVYARDDEGTHFDVEMQIEAQHVQKRARYYHSQMDMELISTGAEYETLPDGYVIFICDFDPLGLGKYRYTVRHTLVEDSGFRYEDGIHTIFLNTKGTNEDEVPEELVRFLRFVGADREASTGDFGDNLVKRLQDSIEKIKSNREMGENFMEIEKMMQKEYMQGREDGRLEGRQEGRQEGMNILAKVVLWLRAGDSEEQLLADGADPQTVALAKSIM